MKKIKIEWISRIGKELGIGPILVVNRIPTMLRKLSHQILIRCLARRFIMTHIFNTEFILLYIVEHIKNNDNNKD